MKKAKLLLMAIAIIASYGLKAQVAINTDGSDPDGSAMLDVKSTDKGFLLPRMTSLEIYSISNPAEGLIVFDLTGNEIVFYNGSQWINFDGTLLPPAIGVFYAGGIVFYLDGSGGGLVCAVSDQSSSAIWGCAGTAISGADGTAIGTGAQNTIDIEAGCTTPGIAADVCANLSLNGYTDWFLPSKDELNELYINKATIDATALANGGTTFASTPYWSSTENFAYGAWWQRFNDGYQGDWDRNFTYHVRAVRAF